MYGDFGATHTRARTGTQPESAENGGEKERESLSESADFFALWARLCLTPSLAQRDSIVSNSDQYQKDKITGKKRPKDFSAAGPETNVLF